MRSYYERNREKILEKKRVEREQQPEKVAARKREFYKRNRASIRVKENARNADPEKRAAKAEYDRDRYIRDRQKIRVKQNARSAITREAKAVYDRAYRQSHLARLREKSRAYAAAHKDDPEFLERRRERSQRRRARKTGAHVRRVYRRAIYERDEWRCQLCGGEVDLEARVPHPLAPTIDHIVPLAAGGAHEPGNVQTAHFSCNARKGAATDVTNHHGKPVSHIHEGYCGYC